MTANNISCYPKMLNPLKRVKILRFADWSNNLQVAFWFISFCSADAAIENDAYSIAKRCGRDLNDLLHIGVHPIISNKEKYTFMTQNAHCPRVA
jgi:hypothetical protein